MRVQIPYYHDMWMKGDRWGDVISTSKITSRAFKPHKEYELADVKLDKSGDTVRVLLDDCTVVDVEPRL
jgi:hypothetical protein